MYSNSSNPICAYCNTNYTLVTNTSGTFCIANSTTTCSTSYYPSSTSPLQCQPCHPSCQTCTLSSTNCTSCKPTYTLINNLCIYNGTVPQTCPSNCALCASSTLCIVCNLPYVLMINVTAISGSTTGIAICVNDCGSGYYR